jgi:hypothetical protein
MKLNLIIAEDFYDDPDTVRSFALAQPFDVVGNYPGVRTKPFINDVVKIAISKLVETTAGPVTNWHEDCGFTGAFQLCTANDRTWIHADSYNTWAGVLYLTPNAPLSGGTSLYRHKATGNRAKVDDDYESYDYTKWEEVDRIGNIYNRLILYRGNMFHASVDYFGSTYEDGRLFQTFFFNTEH